MSVEPRAVEALEGGRAIYLALDPDPVLAFLHLPASREAKTTAVLICPPFGWEEMCSYRARRAWALALAKAGFPALRIDFPGAGDSGGSPSDPDRLGSWTDAVSSAAEWLRETTGCERVAAIGIGLGGMVACKAVGEGAPIDDLILWAVPARGRRLVRELQAYAGVVAARYPAEVEDPPPLPEGAIEVTGFLLSSETASALSGLTLTDLPLPNASGRRVLLIERDGLGVDKNLQEYFEQQGASVTIAASDDYSALMAHPQHAKTPHETIERSLSWLAESDALRTGPLRGDVLGNTLTRASTEVRHAGAAVNETLLELELGPGRAFGVLSEPAVGERVPVCAVLLNSGAIRRIGPNRTWVEIARSWAARGIPTVRVDLAGIGDSDGDERKYVRDGCLYTREMTKQVLAVLDQLEARALPGRFILVGLCSGAYWALHSALADRRIAAAMMINLYAFEWSEALVAERDRRETVAALRGDALRRLARGRVTREQIGRALRSIRRSATRRGPRGSVEAGQVAEMNRALDTLRDRGTQVLMLLSTGEPLYDQFAREGFIDKLDRWPNMRLQRIPSSDHMSRALWLQRRVEQSLDAALERVLAAEHARSG